MYSYIYSILMYVIYVGLNHQQLQHFINHSKNVLLIEYGSQYFYLKFLWLLCC